MSRLLRVLTLLPIVLLPTAVAAGCRADPPAPAAFTATASPGGDRLAAAEWFTDIAALSGLDFVHFNGMSGEHYYPEIMAPGVALFDYDNDGDLDVYAVQGQMLGAGKSLSDAVFAPAGALEDRLFRNDLTVSADGTRTTRFTDATAQSGIVVRSYGMGVAAGDFDNDGWVDLYRTGLSGSVLLHNNRDGTFSDVTGRTGVENRGGWGVSAAFLDYDRDGWLDLFVGNYLLYSLAAERPCLSVAGQRDYCPPDSYRAQPSRLYHNQRNGTFRDVTGTALVGGAYGPALGVATADVNGDGWIDIYVANDGQPNLLWINQHDGTFKESAQLAGAAVSGAGTAEAGMGVDAGDFDNDGDEDLFVTNWQNQMNTLYVNDGLGNFEDRKAASGLGRPSLAKTGFGTGWFDADNDGWLDLLTVNGSVAIIEAQARANDPFPLRMTNQLYRNRRDGHFDEVSADAGPAFRIADVGRGAAFGDIDNDGDTDVVIASAAGRLRLLRNNVGNRAHWIGLRLIGARTARDMLGARVEIVRAGQPTLFRRARADGSYASASDPRVLVGLGAAAEAAQIRVTWPDGGREEWPRVAADRWTSLKQGESSR
ncbi:MAG: CRTAC1 family protein [Acidobacteriota bacterium]